MLDPMPTAALTAAIANGDEVAFGAFYDAWFDAALALTRAVSHRDEAFALDVVQDVMLKVVQKLAPLATETMEARGLMPRLSASARRMTMIQEAPASRPGALPAVTVGLP